VALGEIAQLDLVHFAGPLLAASRDETGPWLHPPGAPPHSDVRVIPRKFSSGPSGISILLESPEVEIVDTRIHARKEDGLEPW